MNLSQLENHLEKLRSFRVIVESGAISRASVTLGLSQSSLSHSIMILENAIQAKLLDRQSRGVKLTEDGRILYEFSKRLHLEVKSVETRIRSPKEPFSGHLMIATHETLAVHIWPSFLKELKAKYPLIHISLISSRIDSIVKGLINRDFHLSLSVEPALHPKLEKEIMFTGELGLYVAPKERCVFFNELCKDKLLLKDVKRIPVVTDMHAHLRQGLPIPQYLSSLGLNPSIEYELNSFEAAIRFAAQGLGIAAIPVRNAREAVTQKIIRPIKIRDLRDKTLGGHSICTTNRKDCENLALTKLLVEELKNYFSRL